MSVGVVELALLGIVALAVVPLAVLTCHRWLLGFVACFAVAVVATPPDVVTTLILGVPLSAVYGVVGLVWLAPRARGEKRRGDRTGSDT